ncbi:hypothetical protein [Flavimobilis soli]|uniref:hypothetical protein n=1 Tax=Flavimobilis soli TaxID=442709 RepID=UPI00117A5620|nr:hypothetical protein [Flavimobilis soli]
MRFKKLDDLRGGGLILRGKPRTYLTPDTVAKIRALMKQRAGDAASDSWEQVVQVPVGDPGRPEPSTMTLEQWAVEEFIVAPVATHGLRRRRGLQG